MITSLDYMNSKKQKSPVAVWHTTFCLMPLSDSDAYRSSFEQYKNTEKR